MSLTSKNQLLIAFKKLVGKAHTNAQFGSANESIGSNVQIDNSTVFSQTIPSSPNSSLYSITNDIVEKVQFNLVSIPSSQYTAAGTTAGGITADGDGSSTGAFTNGIHAFALTLPSNYTTLSSNLKKGSGVFLNNQSLTASNGALQIVPERYGSSYLPSISSSSGILAALAAEDYLLDPYSGILFVQDIERVPTSVTAYLYIGDYLTERVTSFVGNFTSLNATSLYANSLYAGPISGTTAEFTTLTASFISASSYLGIPPTNPGGINQSIQFNSGSTFSGSNNLIYNYTTNVLSGTTAQFTTLSASSANVSGSLVIDGPVNLAQFPEYAYVLYTASFDKIVVYPGLYVSGNLTGSGLGTFQTVSGSTALFTTITASNISASNNIIAAGNLFVNGGQISSSATTLTLIAGTTVDIKDNTIITGTLNVTSNSTFAEVSGTTAQFTILSGSTITGSTALFASDIFVSGSRIGRGPGAGATSNIVFGASALNLNTTGFSNVAIGPSALSVNSIGFRNVAIGDRALENNTGGDDNIAIGATAAQATTGDRNTIVGSLAFQFNTVGSDNTGLGNRALQQNTTGVGNTAIGRAALVSNTIGSNNTALGNSAGENLNTGSFNLFLGAGAGGAETNLSNTVIISANAERMRIDSNGNVGIAKTVPNARLDVSGSAIISGNLNVTGSITTTNVTASNGILFERGAYDVLLTVSSSASHPAYGNYIFGFNSNLNANGTNLNGYRNISIGDFSLQNNISGTYNIAIGHTTLQSNIGASNNIALGAIALQANTLGFNNVAIGSNALAANTEGISNIGIGFNALRQNTLGDANIGIGSNALNENTTGIHNVGLGQDSLRYNNGSYNFATGYLSLAGNVIGSFNTSIGREALRANVTGSQNIGIGNKAFFSNVNGNNNIGIGQDAGELLSTGSNNLFLGNFAGNTETNLSDTVIISVKNNTERLRIDSAGNMGIGRKTPGARLHVSGSVIIDQNLNVTGSAIVSGNLTVTGSTILTTISGTTAQFTNVTGNILRTNGLGIGADYTTNGANVAAFSAEDPIVTMNMGVSGPAIGNLKWYYGSTHYMSVGFPGTDTTTGIGIPVTLTTEQINVYSPKNIALHNGYGLASGLGAGMLINFTGSNYFTWRGASNTDALYTDQSRMTYIGNLRLGSATSETANAKLDVSGSAIISGNLTVTGSITELSTRRIKTDIHSLSGQLDTLHKLNPVSYVRLDDGRKEYGFISEEVKEVYPEFVVGEGINYPKMVSVLVSAVKELTQKVQQQQTEIELIKNRGI